MRWLGCELESQEAATQHSMVDPNVPTQLASVALDVDASSIRKFELALKQKLRRIAVSPFRTSNDAWTDWALSTIQRSRTERT